MVLKKLQSLLLLTAAVAATGGSLPATAFAAQAADAFPQKPITIVVGFSAGGQTDLHARLLGEAMSGILGQSFIVENKPGAGSSIAAAHVAKARNDGYTLLYGGVSALTLAQYTYPGLTYSNEDFQPVVAVEEIPLALMVDAQKIPARNLKEYTAYARDNRDTLHYATTGAGVITHLLGEQIKSVLDLDTPPVHYRGSAQATIDVIGGQVPVIVDGLGQAMPYLKEGRLHAIGVSSSQRLPTLPDVPTFIEQGYPDLNLAPWAGLLAPAGTPVEVLEKLNAAALQAMQSPELQARFVADGTIPVPGDLKQTGEKARQAHEAWGAIATRLKLSPQ